ncbi:BCCT family transporter [Metabacillus sp. GX 13764]|uniref:glycine betaine uptake BCCT transporter n=1 Tax=Metabacillus kandeliae TaxID=2900151 RepID=UPI001E3A92BA|nr:BCCT family transporter [Metabacillus kandeliae]MCD7033961.1 BCCT family transporter [Metabacillus kandeliae]
MKRFTNVFIISVIVSALFIIWGALPKSITGSYSLSIVTTAIMGFITKQFGWFYLLSATFFLVFAIVIIFTKFGNIRLGKDTDRPEYSYISWFSMLFSAGMGIGLVFWGVAEPLNHYSAPPTGEPSTNQAAKDSLLYSFFHWGLHPWAIYSVLALALAYFTFRKGENGVISSILRPLIGKRADGGIGTLVNVIAVFATIFGVATSLGLGAIQIAGGTSFLFPAIQNNFTTQLVIIIIVTFLFIISAQTGLDKGIKYLSNLNVILAIALMLFLLFAGPTNFILDFFTTTLGRYVQELPSLSLRMFPFDLNNKWLNSWTLFYWAWWISWAPFVGTFIARISKGRTIREFVIGVLAVPTIFGALWFSVFGGSAIFLEHVKHLSISNIMNDKGTEVALFAMLQHFPLGYIMSLLAIFLIGTFFITSADSATFVLGMQTTNGSLNPSNSVKMVWGLIQSGTAVILLYTGGLTALQTVSIIAALPFAVIMIFIVFALLKALKSDPFVTGKKRESTEKNRTV